MASAYVCPVHGKHNGLQRNYKCLAVLVIYKYIKSSKPNHIYLERKLQLPLPDSVNPTKYFVRIFLRTAAGQHDSLLRLCPPWSRQMCLLRFICKADKGFHDARADLVREGAFLGDQE